MMSCEGSISIENVSGKLTGERYLANSSLDGIITSGGGSFYCCLIGDGVLCSTPLGLKVSHAEEGDVSASLSSKVGDDICWVELTGEAICLAELTEGEAICWAILTEYEAICWAELTEGEAICWVELTDGEAICWAKLTEGEAICWVELTDGEAICWTEFKVGEADEIFSDPDGTGNGSWFIAVFQGNQHTMFVLMQTACVLVCSKLNFPCWISVLVSEGK
ncbi:unnamed protein product [Mytilus coruscus]|uniref:Uncharacterized protein n=1 Tax=Mytilus coruscus TaxID=42192 RepID=A0A6J8EE00_MYTCO|nr:unnamed protein product [Mytilus coruscus]